MKLMSSSCSMKRTFIPPHYRPNVPGASLSTISQELVLKPGDDRVILILSAKEDIIPQRFLYLIREHADNIVHLFYEDLGTTWSFTFANQKLRIHHNSVIIEPQSIYHRHPGVIKDHPHYHLHLTFLQALELWTGAVIGQKNSHYLNCSKPLQMILSLRAAREDNFTIKLPTTKIVKTKRKEVFCSLKEGWIVKSCSNVRSQVATGKEYCRWDKENLDSIPTLFQEKIEGSDLRVHLIDDHLWSIEITGKTCVDYRYAKKKHLTYATYPLPDRLRRFCVKLSEVEQNSLAGIDFIKKGDEYWCLECNPGPGWSTFPHQGRKLFADKIFKKLNKRVST